jgi:hypothetical protein
MREWDEHANCVGYLNGVPRRRVGGSLGRNNRWRRVRLQTSAAMNTNPLTVPSDLDHQELAG